MSAQILNDIKPGLRFLADTIEHSVEHDEDLEAGLLAAGSAMVKASICLLAKAATDENEEAVEKVVNDLNASLRFGLLAALLHGSNGLPEQFRTAAYVTELRQIADSIDTLVLVTN